MDQLTVDQIDRQMAELQEARREAVALAEFKAGFPVHDEKYLLIAKRRDERGPFAGHAEEGIPVAIFDSREEAEEYRDGIPRVVGRDLVVELLDYRMRAEQNGHHGNDW